MPVQSGCEGGLFPAIDPNVYLIIKTKLVIRSITPKCFVIPDPIFNVILYELEHSIDPFLYPIVFQTSISILPLKISLNFMVTNEPLPSMEFMFTIHTLGSCL